MCMTICVERAADHFGLSLTWIDLLLTKICAKSDFHSFIPSDLDLWPLDLKFAPLVTLVQRYVSTKLEVSTAFLFRENRTHERTERVQHLMQPLGRDEE